MIRVAVVVRYRRVRSRWSRFVTGSIAAHGALLAVLVVVPLMHRPPPPIEDAMVVALAGPVGGAPAPARATAPPAAAPPQPPAPPPKEAHTVKEVPEPKPKEDKQKKKEPKKEPVPAPAAPQPPGPPSEPRPSTAPTAAGPAAGATGVTASVGGGDQALGWYEAAVRAALESAWIKPYIENQGATYSVTVAFEILRDGRTRDIRIVEPSGVPRLDRSAERAVLEASPLPAVPPTWTGDILPATMRFDLTPDAH